MWQKPATIGAYWLTYAERPTAASLPTHSLAAKRERTNPTDRPLQRCAAAASNLIWHGRPLQHMQHTTSPTQRADLLLLCDRRIARLVEIGRRAVVLFACTRGTQPCGTLRVMRRNGVTVVRGYARAATVCTINAERFERRQPPDCVRRSTAVEAIASGAEGVNALGKDGTKQRRRASVDACVCAACVCACAARDEDTAKQCPSLSEMTLMRACMICKAEPPPVPVASHAPARAARDTDLLEKLALAHALELSELRRDPRIKLRAESPMQCPRRVAARRERRRTEGPGVKGDRPTNKPALR